MQCVFKLIIRHERSNNTQQDKKKIIGTMKILLLNLKNRFPHTDMNQHFSQTCNFYENNSIQIFI